MKNLIFLIILFILCLSAIKKEEKTKENENVKPIFSSEKENKRKYAVKSFFDFQNALILSESSGVVDTVHQKTGCTGLFQFSHARAKDLNTDLKKIKMMSSKEQKSLFKKHVRDLKNKIGDHDYAYFRKIGLTDGSMIAIAHLGGVEGLKQHVYGKNYKKEGKKLNKIYNYDPNDGKTKLSGYRDKFKQYDGFLALF